MHPTVSFVVPCYKLAHLLGECIESILSQTYGDFEILIMDDCSPDNTAAIAHSFQDPRIRYIRNEINLKHLQNYNKGISLARGKYIWLISADDCLRRPYVLDRYVRLLDEHPNVGYVFCSAVGLFHGEETDILDYSMHGSRDAVFQGRRFLEKLIHANTIVAASGCVRKECYEKVGLFPLDLPWGGDWYLWCAFALHFDVGYFAEPMVSYRRHEVSMTNVLMESDIGACYSDDIRIPWLVKAMADVIPGCERVVKECLRSIAYEYAQRLAGKQYKAAARSVGMSIREFDVSVDRSNATISEKTFVRARVYSGLGDRYYKDQNFPLARDFYYRSLRKDFLQWKVWAKWLLIACGRVGIEVRSRLGQRCLP